MSRLRPLKIVKRAFGREFGPAVVALLYAVFGVFWILFSDALALRFPVNGLSMHVVQTFKGLLYVGLTAGLVYGLARYSTRRIREERARYREMADNVEDLFYSYDTLRDRLVYAGPSYERIWGRSLKAAYENPMSYLEAIHPEDRPRAIEADRRQRRGEPTVTEYRVIRPDGVATWILDRSVSIMRADGVVERIVGSMRDITAVKHAQEALAQSQRRLETLLDNLPGAAFRCRLDRDWTTLFMSQGIARLTGFQPHEYLGNASLYGDHIHPEDRDRVYAEIAEASERGETYEVEYRIFTRDDMEKAVWERGRFFPGDLDEEGYLEGFILDVTDRKRAEAERKRLEERYRQGQKLEAIGQLAGGVAHDFNNLLTVILVRSEMALRKVKPGDGVHAGLREIHDAAQRSAGLARQLLTYAQRQPVKTRVMTLNPLIEAALPMLRRLVGGDIRLAWSLAPDPWAVSITPTHLDQILVNLCLNARDAMPDGGTLRIEARNLTLDAEDCRVRPELKPGDHVVLSVTDTGCGMDASTLTRLFEPFFTTKEIGKGTGLGLPTVHGIVRQLGGTIEVDSEPGKGAVFRILLPRHPETSPDAGTSEGAGEPEHVGGADEGPKDPPGIMNALQAAKGETVLVVDEDPGVRRLAADILSGLGYVVLEAHNAESAERIAAEHAGDIHLVMCNDESERAQRGLAERIAALRPRAAHLIMSRDPAVVNPPAPPRSGGATPARRLVVRKPLAMADLALKAREALSTLGP
jgi:two-component system cell cycle sensor histidine kinase/response regulator CckA